MPRGHCRKHGAGCPPWAAGFGRMNRLVEPAVLYLLATGQATHGYEIITAANELYLTDAVIDAAAVYRVLRDLEEQGCVVSSWSTEGSGPARRVYQITDVGRQRLAMWVQIIERRARQMQEFVERYRASSVGQDAAAS